MNHEQLTRSEAIARAEAGADAMLASMAAALDGMRSAAQTLADRYDVRDAWVWIANACRDD